MCEVGSAPDHEDGLLGDAVTVLLSASAAKTEAGMEKYTEASKIGQVIVQYSVYTLMKYWTMKQLRRLPGLGSEVYSGSLNNLLRHWVSLE